MIWQQQHYPAGTPVHLFRANLDGYEPLEAAVLLTDYTRHDPASEHPRFRTAAGDELRGSECWWIPVAEAERETESVVRTSPLRRDCAACGDEIQPFEPYRRVALRLPSRLGPFYRAYHVGCDAGTEAIPRPVDF